MRCVDADKTIGKLPSNRLNNQLTAAVSVSDAFESVPVALSGLLWQACSMLLTESCLLTMSTAVMLVCCCLLLVCKQACNAVNNLQCLKNKVACTQGA